MINSTDRVNNVVIKQYFRTSDDNLQINSRVNPINTVEDWITCCEELTPSFGVVVPDSLGNLPTDNDQLLVGELLVRYNNKCLDNKALVDSQSSLRSSLGALSIMFDECLQAISDAFFDAAEERGWCPLAIDLIKELNQDLPATRQLPMREKEFKYKYTSVIQVEIEGEGTIMARDQDEADDKLREYSIMDHVGDRGTLREMVETELRSNTWEEVSCTSELED